MSKPFRTATTKVCSYHPESLDLWIDCFVATWKSRYDYGVGMNSYLSDRASRNGVWDNIMMIDGVRAPSFAEIPPRKAEADTMEALIGAVHLDSGCNKEVVKEVATCLGVYYPEKGIDAEKFDRWIAFLQGSGIVGTTKR